MIIPPPTVDSLRRECRAACHESRVAERLFLAHPTDATRTRWLEALIVCEAAHLELIRRLQRHMSGAHCEPNPS